MASNTFSYKNKKHIHTNTYIIESGGGPSNLVAGNPFGGEGDKDPYMDTNLEDFDIDEDLMQIKMTNQEIVSVLIGLIRFLQLLYIYIYIYNKRKLASNTLIIYENIAFLLFI